jgi:hypothetical protein
VTGVVPGRFAERELLGDSVEAVAAVAYPIRPGNEILTPPGSTHLLNTEAAYYIATLDREAAESRPDLGDDGTIGA